MIIRVPKFKKLNKVVKSWAVIFLIVFVAFILVQTRKETVEAAWFDDIFSFRNPVDIASHTAAENNVYVSVTVDTSSNVQADCGDLRWTDARGKLLKYYVSSGCTGASTVIHVFMDTMPAGQQTLYYYYGNASVQDGFSAADFATAATGLGTITVGSQETNPVSPINYWKLDEGSGTSSSNSFLGGNPLTLNSPVNLPTWQLDSACVTVKCLLFEGSNATASAQTTTISNLKSVSFWVKPSSSSGTIPFISFSNGTGDIAVTSSNLTLSAPGLTSPTFYVNGVSSTTLTANAWNHVVVTTGTVFTATNMVLGKVHLTFFKGYLDEVKLYNFALSASQVKNVYAARGASDGVSTQTRLSTDITGPVSSGLVGYWKMDEAGWTQNCTTPTVIDSSGTGNTLLSCPSTTGPTTTVGKFGQGGSFDGSDDYIYISSNSTLKPTNDMTISLWVKLDVLPSTRGEAAMLARKDHSASPWHSYQFYVETDNQVYFQWLNSSGTTHSATAITVLTAGTWYHLTAWKSSTGVKVFVNGVDDTFSTPTPSGTILDSDGIFTLGAVFDNQKRTDGIIDDVRFYNRALETGEIVGLYNWGRGPINWWKLDEGQGYYSTSSGLLATTGTISPSISVPPSVGLSGWQQAGKFGKALALNGTNNYVDFGDLTYTKNVGTMSASLWVRPNALGTSQCFLCKWNDTAGAGSRTFALETDSSDSTAIKLEFSTDGNTGIASAVTGTGKLGNNKWTHVAFSYDSSQTTNATILKLYVNGVLQTLTFTGTIPNLTQSNTVKVRAGSSSDGARFFPGMIDEIKFYTGALSAAEILVDYNKSSIIQLGNFGTASQSASTIYCIPGDATSCNSPVGQWELEEGNGVVTADATGNGSNLAFAGGCSRSAGKFGKGAQCNGVDGSGVAVAAPAILEMGTGDQTIEAWINIDPTITTTTPSVVEKGATANSRIGYWLFYQISTNTLKYRIGNGTSRVGPDAVTNIEDGKWHHVAAVADRDGNGYLYIDGQLGGLDAISSFNGVDVTDAARPFNISSKSGNSAMDGVIDHVSIYNYTRTPAQIAWDYNRGLPIVWWKFDECQGSVLNNSVGSVSGTLTGTAGTCATSASSAWYNGRTGKYNASLSFNGSSDYVAAGNANLLSREGLTRTTASWGGWFYPTTSAASKTLMFKKNEFRLTTDASSKPQCEMFTTSWQTAAVSSSALSLSAWSHVLCVYDGANINTYVNGLLTGSTAQTGNITSRSWPLNIARDADNNNQFFSGQIDSVKVWNFNLTATQILTDFNQNSAVRFGPATGSP